MKGNEPPKNRKSPFSIHGFSLLELLVCIAIMAVLFALCVPIYHSVRNRSDQAVSASNLRQCLLFMRNLANDGNGAIQFTHSGAPWINVLWPQAYPDRIFPAWKSDCSNLRGTFFYDPSVRADLALGNPVVRSFGLNTYLYTGSASALQIRLNTLERPASTALLATVGPGSDGSPISSNLSRLRINFRLGNYTLANIGFADGHVQLMAERDLEIPLSTHEDVFWTGRQ